MPNTIAHFAVAGLLTKGLIKSANPRWIYLGCVLPDLPWIMQRLVHTLGWNLDGYDVRAYAVTQSSLALCVILAVAFAFIAKDSRSVLFTLALGAFVHLVLDATQTKWANGVLLMAPLNWELWSLNLFWPESVVTYSLTLIGFVYFVYNFKSATKPGRWEFSTQVSRWLACILILIVWLVLPIGWISHPYEHDHHFISTLKNNDVRHGKWIEFDRTAIDSSASVQRINTAFGEAITLTGITAGNGDLVSIQGRFVEDQLIQVQNLHVHSKFRDKASYAGLFLVLLTWIVYFARMYWSGRQQRDN